MREVRPRDSIDDEETESSNGGSPEYTDVGQQRGMTGVALHYLSPPLRGRRSGKNR